MSMKILLVSSQYPPMAGGGGVYTYYLASALASVSTAGGNKKCDVCVLTSCGANAPHTVRQKPNLRIHYTRFERSGRVPYEAAINYGLRLCQQLKPTVIHGQHFDGFHVASQLSAVCLCPLIATFHNSPFGEIVDGLEYQDARVAAILDASMDSDKLVSSCQFYKAELQKLGVDRSDIKVIWPGIDCGLLLGFAGNTRNAVLENLKTLGLDAKGYDHLVLCPARIDPSKDLETFVRAAGILKNTLLQSSKLAFVIAGKSAVPHREEQEYQHLLEHIAAREDISTSLFFGSFSLPEMFALYRLSSVCVLPSVREAMGLVLIEAFALGVPVVATNVIGISDVVIPEENALVFPPRDYRSLAEQLARILTDEGVARRVRKNGIDTAKKNFSSPRMGKILYNFYKQFR